MSGAGAPKGAPAARSAGLDLFKAMLVAGMVAIHVFQLLALGLPAWMDRVSEAINVVTFSGFLLAMGIGTGLGSDRVRPWPERLQPVLLLLGATWLSSFAFALLVDRTPFSAGLAVDVLSLRRLFGWSEFLASFFMLYLILALARPLLVRMATDRLAFGLSLALAVAATWITVDRGLPASATLLGTTQFASFPLLPYLPWFLIGIRLGRADGRIGWPLWLAACAASGLFAWHVLQYGTLPGRFPPTALWVAGAALPLLCYWTLARHATPAAAKLPALLLPGRHVLSYLLVSNLAIFTARYLWGHPIREITTWLGASALILVGIGLVWWVTSLSTKLKLSPSATAGHRGNLNQRPSGPKPGEAE